MLACFIGLINLPVIPPSCDDVGSITSKHASMSILGIRVKELSALCPSSGSEFVCLFLVAGVALLDIIWPQVVKKSGYHNECHVGLAPPHSSMCVKLPRLRVCLYFFSSLGSACSAFLFSWSRCSTCGKQRLPDKEQSGDIWLPYFAFHTSI